MLQPAFFSAAREAGIGPVPMIVGIDAGMRPGDDARERRLACLAACAALISTSAAAPSLMPEAFAAVTEPSLSKAGRSLPIESSVAPCFGYSSVSTTMSPLRDLIVDRNDLVLELAGLLRGLGLVLRGDRELVLLAARDLLLLGDVLGGGAHVVAVEGIPQPVLDHGVDHLERAHLLAARR